VFINVTDIQEDIGSRQLCQDFEDVATRKHLIKLQDCRNAIHKTRDFILIIDTPGVCG